ncbi:hypothetical protein FOCC_FOCC015686, partial [Frankliniella occidentalis]
MQKDGVVEVATGPTTWVSRPHLVPKKKSGWRMVVDMRNVNAALLRERYPIPTREEMLCKISGSKWFSSLDFKWCYLQFELKEDVRNLTTFVTHFGMFRFKRMAFGLSIAAEVCQRAMEDLKKEALRNIPAEVKEELRKVLEENNMCMEDCIIIFIDDWLVHAPTAWAHNRLLHAVLEETEKDTEIQDILKCLRTGRWTQELKQYRSLEPLLMECQGLLLKGQKIVLPKTLWDQALKLAHEGHLGMTAMKRTLRLKVWWLGMDRFVEDFVSMCFGCQLVNKSFTPEPIVSTALPAYAWEYVAVDFFEFDHKYLLALTDYYSRYVRIEVTKDETALTAVNVLEKIFIELSRPRKLASDNGPCFASKLFQDFLEDWGIVHVHKIRLWPQCNGEIERNNSNFVKRLQIAKGLKKSWKSALYSFVYNYNVTPHSSTGVPPMQLLFTARPLLTKFPTLPEENKEDDAVEEKDREAKFTAKKYADLRRKAAPSTVQVGDTVLRKNEEKSSKTDPPRNPEPAIVVDRKGAEVTVQTPQGKTVQRNVSFFHPL